MMAPATRFAEPLLRRAPRDRFAPYPSGGGRGHENRAKRMDHRARGAGALAPHGSGGVGARRARPRAVSARHRSPRRRRLSARPHAGGLRARDRARRRLHRAGPGGDQGRPPDRPPRAEHHRHHRRGEPSGVRRPRAHQDGRRRPRRPASSPPTSRWPRSRRCAPSSRFAERPQQFNGRFEIPTFEEVIALAKRKSRRERPHHRHLSRDEAPDLPQVARPAARGPAGAGAPARPAGTTATRRSSSSPSSSRT